MLHIVFEDDAILVVNKACGVLSQPGKTRDGSVVSAVRRTCQDARGPILVHRLDMDTSGLLLMAKTRQAHRHLQQQFEHRKIDKRYTALVPCAPPGIGGLIQLPLARDWDNRPKQRVCFDSGKRAVTAWRIVDKAAHTPCGVGDRLYGTTSTRLMLHADRLSFFHPSSGERVSVATAASF